MAEWRAVLSGDLVDPDVRMRGTVVPTSSSRTDGTSWSASWGSADVVRIVEEFEPILDRKTPDPVHVPASQWAQFNTLP
jgi:hypothetical protein